MDGTGLYDRAGRLISLAEFDRLVSDPDYRTVARAVVIDTADPDKAWEIVTTWTGVDLSGGQVAQPVTFLTAVFAVGDEESAATFWHATEAEAVEAHGSMIHAIAITMTDAAVMNAEAVSHG